MEKLKTKLTLNRSTLSSTNLCNEFSPDELAVIGNWVWSGYDKDKRSRAKWEKRNEAGMDLAMQVQKTKTFPWPNCSNVAFPLVTIATMQFHARAYSAIISGPDIVKYRVIGQDPTGQERARALRIGEHMSYQLMEEDDSWEDQHDRLLLNLAVVGSTFKKTYRSAKLGRNTSEMVQAKDLILDYWAKSVEECPRKTHWIPTFRNDIYERVVDGRFRNILDEAWFTSMPSNQGVSSAQQSSQDNRTGVSPPVPADELTPFILLEQHCRLDLDQDGYAEPYIITIEHDSHQVLRIVTGVDREEDIHRTRSGKIFSIRPTEYFTKYSFVPSPDGGIYDIGFGVLLGPLNESVNSIINQMIDAGTFSLASGGFLAKGARIRGGLQNVDPFTWNRVEATNDDVQKALLPFPSREPSDVLFRLLVLLVNYTSRISGSTDIMTGENPGQNQPATTTNTVLEQGLQIYNSIFKRVWRAMKFEFQKLYILNAIHMGEREEFGAGKWIMSNDYHGIPDRIAPSADPHITSDQARLQQAATVAQRAQAVPGYNRDEVERNLLRSMRVDGMDTLFLGAEKTGPLPNPIVMREEIKLQAKQLEVKADLTKFAATLQEEHRLNDAKIVQLEAQAAKLVEEAGGVKTGHVIAAFEAAIGALKVHNESLKRQLEGVLKSVETFSNVGSQQEGVSGMAGAPSNETGYGPSGQLGS